VSALQRVRNLFGAVNGRKKASGYRQTQTGAAAAAHTHFGGSRLVAKTIARLGVIVPSITRYVSMVVFVAGTEGAWAEPLTRWNAVSIAVTRLTYLATHNAICAGAECTVTQVLRAWKYSLCQNRGSRLRETPSGNGGHLERQIHGWTSSLGASLFGRQTSYSG